MMTLSVVHGARFVNTVLRLKLIHSSVIERIVVGLALLVFFKFLFAVFFLFDSNKFLNLYCDQLSFFILLLLDQRGRTVAFNTATSAASS